MNTEIITQNGNKKDNNTQPILVTEDLIKVYKSGKDETQALRGISLKVYESEKVFLIGPSGSGKTTLVNIIAGIDKPTSGKVYWRNLNKDITRSSYEEIIKARRDFAGIIFQDTKLIPHLTVKENVLLTAHYAQLEPSVIEERLKFLLNFMGIWDKKDKKQNILSGGEQKRAAIAATLITNPKIIIADEPTGDLDIKTAETILDLFDRINTELNIALLVVTHSQQVASRADRLLELKDGIILAQHDKNVKLRDLSTTRRLEIDRQNRINIPEPFLMELEYPTHFTIKLVKGNLILTPTYQTGNTTEYKKLKTCSNCGEMVKSKNFCPKCGAVVK
ncbi:MAG: ATP-binding cassette domain-containing protein [Candidatus Heimdallarchaeaceae archaeon]